MFIFFLKLTDGSGVRASRGTGTKMHIDSRLIQPFENRKRASSH